jgi:hypothetical protein
VSQSLACLFWGRSLPPRFGQGALALCALFLGLAARLSPAAGLCSAAELNKLANKLVIDSADLVRCQNGVVVSVHPLASRIGVGTLTGGGTAVDAAVATALPLAVTWPGAGNIGGGRYMVIVPTSGEGPPIAVDFRETGPAAAIKEMFVAKEGRTAHRRVGVPGTVRGLALAHRRIGRLASREVVMPAVRLARDGFAMDAATADSLNDIHKKSDRQQFAALHRVYGKADGKPWQAGERLVQPQLAVTLQEIAERGPDAFYLGPTAHKIAAEMRRGGGLTTWDDLAAHQPKFRQPVRGTFGALPPQKIASLRDASHTHDDATDELLAGLLRSLCQCRPHAGPLKGSGLSMAWRGMVEQRHLPSTLKGKSASNGKTAAFFTGGLSLPLSDLSRCGFGARQGPAPESSAR